MVQVAPLATRFGVDIGGTFTDLIFYDDRSGDVRVAKALLPRRAEEHVLGAAATQRRARHSINAYSSTRGIRLPFAVLDRSTLAAEALIDGPAIIVEETATRCAAVGAPAHSHRPSANGSGESRAARVGAMKSWLESTTKLARSARGARPGTPLAAVRRSIALIAHDRALAAGILMLGLLIAFAVLGPLLWHRDPLALDVGAALQAPSAAHPMGTDGVGRDIFARFSAGAQISLATGALVVLTGAVVGGTIGVLAGVSGGWIDNLLMRAMDAILAFPPLILAMAVTVGLGVGVMTAAIGIMITSVPVYARLLRSEALRVRTLPFVEAAAALGATRLRIIMRHIVPHLMSTLLIQAATVFGYTMLSLAALGFVGLGAQVPTPEWGTMITDGLQYTLTGQWWIGVFPGIGLLAAVTATSLIADGARDILDPRGRYAQV